MNRMLGYDLSGDGHHYLYNVTVMQHLIGKDQFEELGYCTLSEHAQVISELRDSGIKVHAFAPPKRKEGRLGLWRRLLYLAGMLLYARKRGYGKVHLFHLDSVILPLLFVLPLLIGLRVTGTLHWYPTKRLKRGILLFLLRWKAIDRVVVHGNYTHARMLRDGCAERDVANIPVPCFKRPSVGTSLHLAEVRNLLTDRKRPHLLCFGGMRYDKGIDILMRALAAVRELEFTVIVAGAEDDFKEADLDRWIREYKLEGKVFKDIRYIPETVKNFYMETCDAVILPYRRMFSGISGPMTEGAAAGKFVLGPSHGEIGYTIETYRIGETFEAENPADLADKLRKLVNRLRKGNAPSHGAATSLYARFIRDEKQFGEKYGRFLA